MKNDDAKKYRVMILVQEEASGNVVAYVGYQSSARDIELHGYIDCPISSVGVGVPLTTKVGHLLDDIGGRYE